MAINALIAKHWMLRYPTHSGSVNRRAVARTGTAWDSSQRRAQWMRGNVASQLRDDRAHRYVPVHGRDELVAGLMVDALDQASDTGSRHGALVHFVERVGADEAEALRRALDELESGHRKSPPGGAGPKRRSPVVKSKWLP